MKMLHRTGVKICGKLMFSTYGGDLAGLRGPLFHETIGVRPPMRRCRLKRSLGWLSEHALVRCGHLASEDLPEFVR